MISWIWGYKGREREGKMKVLGLGDEECDVSYGWKLGIREKE